MSTTTKWTMATIRKAHKESGGHWFDPSSMRFFRSIVARTIYQGAGGVYFVSSEEFVGSDHKSGGRKYSVRQFKPDTARIDTVGKFNIMSREDAIAKAKQLAKG